MKKTAVMWIFIALSVLLFIAVKCDNGNGPKPPAARPLTLLEPKGGTGVQFHVGDTVMIRWSVNNNILDSDKVASVGLCYSKDGGVTFPTNQMIYWGGSLIPPDTTYLWTIDSTQISNQFVIKVYEYSMYTPFDKSAPFIIVQ